MTPFERAREFWVSRLGCPVGSFVLPGLTLVRHPGDRHPAERAVFALRTGESVVVAAPEALHPALAAVLEPGSLVTPESLAPLLPPEATLIGPAIVAYLEGEVIRPAGVLTLDSARDSRLGPLRDAVTQEEWRHANLEAAEPPLFCCEHQGRIAAAAGFERLLDRVAHLGVISDPRARERGLGRLVTQASAAYALELALLPQFQTLAANQGALRVGWSLGFAPFATTLAARW